MNLLLTRYTIIIHTRKTKNRKSKYVAKNQSEKSIMTNEMTPILLPNLIETLKPVEMDTT